MRNADWTEHFKGTSALPRAVRNSLLNGGKIAHFRAGELVFSPYNIPDSLIFLIDGTIRVSQTSENGRDIVLYRVEAGESCVLTSACMLAEEAYNAEGCADTDVKVVLLPRAVFETLTSDEPAFRSFVFAAYSRRLIDLLRVVDDVAFGRIDVRLAERLIVLAGENKDICITHHQLASELGTAREVISRVLHDFVKRGLLSQTRGKITLLDHEQLALIGKS